MFCFQLFFGKKHFSFKINHRYFLRSRCFPQHVISKRVHGGGLGLKILKIGERKNKMCAVVLKRTWCSVRARCLFDSGIRGAKHLFEQTIRCTGSTDRGETGDVRQEHGEESKGRKRSGPTETTLDENKWGARAHRDSVRDFSKGVF
jgi:hypothetical protein